MKVGEYQEKLNENENAVKNYEESYIIYKEILDFSDKDNELIIGDLQNLIGPIAMALGDYEKAELAFQESLEIFEKYFNEDNLLIQEIKSNLKVLRFKKKTSKFKSLKHLIFFKK